MRTQGIYEQRLCAFVDVLGFRDLVLQSVDRPGLQDQIRQLLREVVQARPVWERDSPVEVIEARLRRQGVPSSTAEAERLVNEYAAAERGSSFSDSVVLSATLNGYAITGLFTSLLFLSRGLAECGKYARGAVCLGLLCHEQDLCFGPALIAAYDLEKEVTIYPRIVFSPEAYEATARVNLVSVGPLAPYLRKDADGYRFLDFLNPAALDLAGPFRADQLRAIRHDLDKQLSYSKTPPQVQEKLLWLAQYFNLVLKETPTAGIAPLSIGA